ncbi:hypothetical protein MMC22_007529 [Lobaria immixta]|nr:hypothetical protein [Lobaria immixta]
MAFLKSEHVINSAEFQELPIPVQEHLQRETVPHYEFTSHTPPLWVNEHEELKPTDTYLSILAFGQNPQSTGSVRLKSADLRDGLLIDPQFLSHAFDRRSAIEAVRHTLDLIESPSLSKSTIRLIGAPRSRSDEDILDYVRSTLYSSWHMCGTVKMGKPGEETTCVDKNFRVVGIDALLVVDMSIAPIMTNNHTQSVAYLIGETAAEKLIQEYGMDNEMISMKSS